MFVCIPVLSQPCKAADHATFRPDCLLVGILSVVLSCRSPAMAVINRTIKLLDNQTKLCQILMLGKGETSMVGWENEKGCVVLSVATHPHDGLSECVIPG